MAPPTAMPTAPSRAELRALAILSRQGAELAAAQNAPHAGVFAPDDARLAEGERRRALKPAATLPCAAVAAWLSRDWIEQIKTPGRAGSASLPQKLRRWRLTPAGAAAARRWTHVNAQSRANLAAANASAAESPMQAQHRVYARQALAPQPGEAECDAPPRRRVNTAESPLAWLARRKDRQGRPFLTAAEVEAGERLRADFEAAQLGPRLAQNWSRFLAVVDEAAPMGGGAPLGSPPAERVSAALRALGPGLADAVWRACCLIEGLEALEQDLGWSSRSGKVVLKIALQRLAAHYGLERGGPEQAPVRAWRA